MPSRRPCSRVLWLVAAAFFHYLCLSLAWQAPSSAMISCGALSTAGSAISNGRAPFESRRDGCWMCAASADLDEHRDFVDRVLSITGDPLEEAGGRVVVYRGNPGARLMIIGEAPGQEEDSQGLPFVGRSGKLLDSILNAVGIDPERDVYISNIVRRRPPDNRTPTAEELEFYVPILLEEIGLVDPDIIVTLGASSTKALLPHEARGITKTRGTWVSNDDLLKSHGGALGGRRLMPWFHPSYLLRNAGEKSIQEGGVRWLTREDLREVKRTLDALAA